MGVVPDRFAVRTGERVLESDPGRESESGPYFDSVANLKAVLEQFSEAEFDLCGSFPYSPAGFEDDEVEDEFEGDEASVGSWLTVEFVAHYGIADEEKLIQAGRDAYQSAWPEQTSEDAEIRVTSPSVAIGELLHAEGLAALETDNDYLLPRWHQLAVKELAEEDPGPDM